MPEPLDLRWWDTMRGAVQGLSAASLDCAGLMRGNCLLSNLWLHCEQILIEEKKMLCHIVIVFIKKKKKIESQFKPKNIFNQFE